MTKRLISDIQESQVGRPLSPVLSIVVPYYRDDPMPLLQALAKECRSRNDVEILLYDDGGQDLALNKKLTENIQSSAASVALFIGSENKGRAFARNELFRQARAKWVLFLDADMLPQSDSFVESYIAEIKSEQADVIFGGFEVPERAADPELELHRVFSKTSDCLTLEQRRAAGPKYVCSSNLAVRKTVLDAEPFDPEFSGWGWEDSEWAARISKSYRLVHADIPALHLGLETTDTLLSRFQTSGPNYQRFTQKHPDLARSLPLYRIVQKLKNIPGQSLVRPILRGIVKGRVLPIKMRITALKLWRASWYAETQA